MRSNAVWGFRVAKHIHDASDHRLQKTEVQKAVLCLQIAVFYPTLSGTDHVLSSVPREPALLFISVSLDVVINN